MTILNKIFPLLIVFLLMACDKSDESGNSPILPDDSDIRFEIQINGSNTRATTTTDFKSAFTNGDIIGLFAVKRVSGTIGALQRDGTNYINNAKLVYTTTSNGGAWVIDNGGEPLYYPNDGSVLDFYAYYPYDAQAADPTEINFALKADQSSTDKFDTNHLMVAVPTTYAKGTLVSLEMNHLTTLVQVELDNTNGAIDPNSTPDVLFTNIELAGTINLNEPAVTDMLTLSGGQSGSTVRMQRIDTSGESTSTHTYRALVPAQTILKNTKLLRIYNGNEIWDSEELNADAELISGKVKKHRQVLPFTIHSERIKAGKFRMAFPLYYVTLTKSFYMSKYEVTNAQYCAFLNAYPHLICDNVSGVFPVAELNIEKINWFGESVDCAGIELIYPDYKAIQYVDEQWVPAFGYENHPACNVSWYGALLFCQWVGGRLPTEVEWEYASRAGSSKELSMGMGGVQITTSNMNSYEWSRDNSSFTSHKVGTKLPNAWGLYDMNGNVSEWCYDLYDEYYNIDYNSDDYDSEREYVDPVNITTGSERVVRGGHWAEFVYNINCNYRYPSRGFADPSSTLGFRVVFPIN